MSETPTDPAVRVLSDAIGGARERRPEDSADPDIPVAATVLLLRDGDAGVDVLMIRRPDRGSFAGAWVFPGGKVDDADRTSPDDTEHDIVRRAGARETWEETGLVIGADALVPLSIWDPPPGIPLRIRTWFFVAAAPTGGLTLSEHEAVAAEWVRPAEFLARHARGEATLYPPTWVTLHGLADAPSVDAVLNDVRGAQQSRFDTVVRTHASGPVLVWAGDPAHEVDDLEAGTARHRLTIGALPWVYTVTD